MDRLARVPPAAVAAAGAMVFVLLSLPGLWTESSTYDEGIHLSAAVAALRGDRRWVPEHPPLGRLPASLPLLFHRPALPDDRLLLERADHWGFGFRFLYQVGNDADRLLRSGRAAMMVWGVVLLVSVYEVARRTYGSEAGLIALVLMAFSPTLLAHGHLVTTDTAAACLMFLAVAAFHRWTRASTAATTAAAGLLLGAALAAKYTAILLLPLLGLMALAARFRRTAQDVSPRIPRLASLAIIGALSLGVIWVAYGFRYAAAQDPGFRFAPHPERSGAVPGAVELARRFRLLPEAYLYGVAELHKHQSEGHWAFAAGQTSKTGWWWYLPFCILVKTPVAALVLLAWGLRAWYRRSWHEGEKDDYLVLAAGILLLGAMKGTLSIGIRHVFPVFPFLAVLAGGLAADRRRLRVAVPVLLAVAALEGLSGAPSFLSYFNLPARALAEREDLLVDSNLDWGQDLARLKAYADRNGIDRLKLGYFGTASPRHLALRHERLPGLNVYRNHEPEWREAAIEPGDFVAVSVTNLKGVYLEDQDFYRRALAGLRPVARIGDSILLYRIPP